MLNHSFGVLPPAGAAFALPLNSSGKQTPFSLTTWHPLALSVYGWPVCNVKIPFSCQLPNSACTTVFIFAPYCLPRPNGSS